MRVGAREVAVGEGAAQVEAARPHHAEPVLGDEIVVADQEAGLPGPVLQRAEHGFHEQVVVGRFADEALAVGVDGDQARLAAVEHQMREGGDRSVAALAQRNGRPEAVAGVLAAEMAAGLLRDVAPSPVAPSATGEWALRELA